MKKLFLLLMLASQLAVGCTTYNLVEYPSVKDANDREITIVYADNIPNARAVANGDHHYMLFNPDYMDDYPEDVQMFIFFHEYGHLMLGHCDTEMSFYTMREKQIQADDFALMYVDTPNIRKYLKSIGRSQ